MKPRLSKSAVKVNRGVVWIQLDAAESILRDFVADYDITDIKKIWHLIREEAIQDNRLA